MKGWLIFQAQCPPNMNHPTMDLQTIKVRSLQERIHALYLATVVFGLDYLSLQCFFSELFVFVLFVFVLFVFVLFVFVLFIFALFVFVVFVLGFCYLFFHYLSLHCFPHQLSRIQKFARRGGRNEEGEKHDRIKSFSLLPSPHRR